MTAATPVAPARASASRADLNRLLDVCPRAQAGHRSARATRQHSTSQLNNLHQRLRRRTPAVCTASCDFDLVPKPRAAARFQQAAPARGRRSRAARLDDVAEALVDAPLTGRWMPRGRGDGQPTELRFKGAPPTPRVERRSGSGSSLHTLRRCLAHEGRSLADTRKHLLADLVDSPVPVLRGPWKWAMRTFMPNLPLQRRAKG